jgi:hypothetical protein
VSVRQICKGYNIVGFNGLIRLIRLMSLLFNGLLFVNKLVLLSHLLVKVLGLIVSKRESKVGINK